MEPDRSAAVSPKAENARKKRVEGRLLINLVPWARGAINGKDLGRTPIAVSLAPGRYTLTLANPDVGQETSRQIAIAGGAETRITDW